MPRDGSGVYSTPPGTHGTPNATILSAAYNGNVDDVATDLNTPRPIVAGGTGSTTPAGAMAALGGVLKAGDSMTGALQINPAHALPGQWALQVCGSNTASQSNGLLVDAGSNANDQPLLVRDNTGTKSYFYVDGNGVVNLPQPGPPNLLIGNGAASRGANSKVCIRYDNNVCSALEISTANTIDAGGYILTVYNGRDEIWQWQWAGGAQNQINVTGQWWFINDLKTSGNLLCSGTGNSSIGGNFFALGHGYQPGGGAWGDTSDARIKTVTGDYTHGLAEILQLEPRRFTYKGNDTPAPPSSGEEAGTSTPAVPYRNSGHYQVAADVKEFIGLIAQEAETIMPEMVSQRDGYIDGEPVTDMRVLDSTALVFALVNAVKELTARIEMLEAA